jgi:hypothetical protein
MFILNYLNPGRHKFKSGQIVSSCGALRSEMVQSYEIISQMPEDATGMRQYRIKSVATGGERVVPELELTAYELPPTRLRDGAEREESSREAANKVLVQPTGGFPGVPSTLTRRKSEVNWGPETGPRIIPPASDGRA